MYDPRNGPRIREGDFTYTYQSCAARHQASTPESRTKKRLKSTEDPLTRAALPGHSRRR